MLKLSCKRVSLWDIVYINKIDKRTISFIPLSSSKFQFAGDNNLMTWEQVNIKGIYSFVMLCVLFLVEIMCSSIMVKGNDQDSVYILRTLQLLQDSP